MAGGMVIMDPYPICPKCGKPLKWNLMYFCGNPYVCFTCKCGYDSRLYFRNTVSANCVIDLVRQTSVTKTK